MKQAEEGDLRVWHIPQIPGKPFLVPVYSVSAGQRVLDILAKYDLFQYNENVKPDYANAGGLQRYEADGDGGFDWYDIDIEEELELGTD